MNLEQCNNNGKNIRQSIKCTSIAHASRKKQLVEQASEAASEAETES